MSGVRALLLSGYDAASHRYWRELLVRQLPEYQWYVQSLPDRHFYWRARSNSMTFAFQHRALLEQPTDLLIATSMVDLAALRGFVPALARIPCLLYFHENQFAYPTRTPNSNIINTQLTSIYSALCATRLVFNSKFNRESFFEGAETLLRRMPDGVPSGILDQLRPRSSVLPVPIDVVNNEQTTTAAIRATPQRPVEIVWNHRWEYDKQPQVFFDAMRLLQRSGCEFRLHVMGQSFRQVPEAFADAQKDLADFILTWGYQSDDQYHHLLARAHIVVSTALHDFQGLSMLQAIQRGCVPIAPARVAYPEYIPPELLYACEPQQNEATNLAKLLRPILEQNALPPTPDMSRYLSSALIGDYRSLIDDMLVQG